MQRHAKRMETAKIEMRWLGMGCLRLVVEGKISKKETLKRPALDAVAFAEDFWAVLLAGPNPLWTVTEQETG